MKNKQIIIKADYSRYFPDPLNKPLEGTPLNINHHILLVKANSLPSDIPKDPNPREQKIDRGIYKTVRESLEDPSDFSFHLKNKGITILANRVEFKDNNKNSLILHLDKDDGIIDGGHTYEIIKKSTEEEACPDDQYVKIEVITGVPKDMFVNITGGLNTAVQVQTASLFNLKGEFQWVKDVLQSESYANCIAYAQNEKENEKKPFDIRDILGFMTLFNIHLFKDKTSHPKVAYVSKAQCLDLYGRDYKNDKSYQMLSPILKDILCLHDYINLTAGDSYNKSKKLNGSKGRAAGMKGIFKKRKRGKFKYHFINSESDSRLYDGALFPMLGAMRFLVEIKPGSNVFSWKLNSFEDVKKFFDKVAPEFIETTYNTSRNYGNKPDATAKDSNLWDNLYKTVALQYMEDQSV